MTFDETDQELALHILGSSDMAVIEPAIDAFCREHLRRALVHIHYMSFSVGAGFGLALDNGRSVFMKVWPRTTSLESLDSVHTIQRALATEGFPAPQVLLTSRPFMTGHATVMDWCDRGSQLDAHAAPVRHAMATALAHLIKLATPFADLHGLRRHAYPTNAAFGEAHNVLFDFPATRQGAEWIDEIALAAAYTAQRAPSRAVVGHCDWSMHNVRLQTDRNGNTAVAVVYDWDSLSVARETDVVGMAAAIFSATWDLDVVPRFPTRDEMMAFVAEYEHAALHRFSEREWESIGAAATYMLAYVARCEHCHGNPEDDQSARAALRAHVADERAFVRPVASSAPDGKER